MPRPTQRTLRDGLIEAAARLRAVNSPDLAEHVDRALAPGGWDLLRRTDQTEETSGGNPNFPLQILTTLRDSIRNRPAGSPDPTLVILEAFDRFLAGAWVPQPLEKVRRGLNPSRSTITPRIPRSKVDAVEAVARSDQFFAEHGYRLNARQVATAALIDQYSTDTKVAESDWGRDYQLQLMLPTAVTDHLNEAIRHGGPDPRTVLRAAFGEFLSGKWVPDRPHRAAKGGRAEEPKKKFSVMIDAAAKDQVVELGADPQAVADRGYKLAAGQVATAALMRGYQVPDELLHPAAE